MGNFDSIVKRGLRCIGNLIADIIKWWEEFKEEVNNKVYKFMKTVEIIIKKAENQKTVGEVIAIKKEKFELEKKADELYKTLSSDDQESVNEALKNIQY